MGEQAVNFDDKIVITPVELYRDEELTGECYAVFAVMKSFGPRAEAKVSTYAKRLSSKKKPWSEARVVRYQKMLQKAGWIKLLREGVDGTPRLWWMCRVKNEVPPLQDESRAIVLQGLQKAGAAKRRGSKKQGLQNDTPKQLKGSKAVEVKTQAVESKPARSSASPEDILQKLDPIRVKRYGHPLARTEANKRAAAKLAESVSADILPVVYEAYLADRGKDGRLADEKHPLAWLLEAVDTYLPKPRRAAPVDVAPHMEPKLAQLAGGGLVDAFMDLVRPAREARQ